MGASSPPPCSSCMLPWAGQPSQMPERRLKLWWPALQQVGFLQGHFSWCATVRRLQLELAWAEKRANASSVAVKLMIASRTARVKAESFSSYGEISRTWDLEDASRLMPRSKSAPCMAHSKQGHKSRHCCQSVPPPCSTSISPPGTSPYPAGLLCQISGLQ